MSDDDLFPDLPEEPFVRPVRGNTFRTQGGHVARRIPWWMSLGKGPEGQTCNDCQFVVRRRYSKTYTKCGLQVMTGGAGTDISGKDHCCRLFQQED